MGAIYWARTHTLPGQYFGWNGQPETASAVAAGMDLNYFSFDINSIAFEVLDNGGDACFVRTVKSSAGE
ncbi:MAG: hypothetical protein K2J82_10785 [Muribaculaceae bacterium]|nr:hypothetical protein [Muribaculaceae bacterium]